MVESQIFLNLMLLDLLKDGKQEELPTRDERYLKATQSMPVWMPSSVNSRFDIEDSADSPEASPVKTPEVLVVSKEKSLPSPHSSIHSVHGKDMESSTGLFSRTILI